MCTRPGTPGAAGSAPTAPATAARSPSEDGLRRPRYQPEFPNKGLLSDSMTDVPVDTGVAARTPATEGLTEAEEEELRAELTKVEEEIVTLRQVLAAKERHCGELKRRLGLSTLGG